MSLAGVVAHLVGLSEWSPRRVKRAVVGWILAATAVIAPATFRDGLELFVERQVHLIEQQMQPVLDNLAPPAAPLPTGEVDESSRNRPDDGSTQGGIVATINGPRAPDCRAAPQFSWNGGKDPAPGRYQFDGRLRGVGLCRYSQ